MVSGSLAQSRYRVLNSYRAKYRSSAKGRILPSALRRGAGPPAPKLLDVRRVVVNDTMQKGYVYYCTALPGRNFDEGFAPELTPKQMLELGVFGGKYMTDCRK
jgi:hypothetical protein